jgi:tRNA threonylcarbamoyladenosine biosynthesis protein TsaB
MAIILNIETSTEVCSVTISKDGELLYMKETVEGMSHSQLLTVFIEELFAENNLELNQLDAVAVSKGPGSYTGLRIGVSVAKGLCYGLDIPLLSVNSLEIMGKYSALHLTKYSNENALFCPMIDARRMEVYTALYNSKGEEIKPISAEIIEDNFLYEFMSKSKILFFGNGAEKCKKIITHSNAIFEGPEKTSAQFMQTLSEQKYNKKEFENVAYFEPFYLKNFVATIPKNKIIK